MLTISRRLAIAELNRASIDDVGRAILYESSAADIGPVVAPPWFAPVQQQLNNIHQQLNNIQRQLNRTDAKGSRALNATNGEGTFLPFEVVLFVDGTDPTAPPHNLPALTSTVVIDGLQGVQATDYLNGYNIAVPHLIDNRLNALKVYIGRRML
ncbi:hypothetical protein K443DRAFT_121597 [Laccaria amethystina LaAM-08-1]|uniref:Mug135-like C-terminal domain-containing protein n=1 Tax=Laccaria amethystina LaAM-08-1 TaxID=1095629 RepID=A0A0C9Y4Y7_9AGAR|nr:hypothetical protein K443DRAFT_121597 [Laccaria amethystina LaAM-08-1]